MTVKNNNSLGIRGEMLAEKFLIEKGFTLIEKNYKTLFGEIDLIMCKGKEIVFIEVKTRMGITYGYPEEAITKQKREHIKKSLTYFLKKNSKYRKYNPRMDVISILVDSPYPDIKHITHIE